MESRHSSVAVMRFVAGNTRAAGQPGKYNTFKGACRPVLIQEGEEKDGTEEEGIFVTDRRTGRASEVL